MSELVTAHEPLLAEMVHGIAFPVDRSVPPVRCAFIPRSIESLLKEPRSSLTYEDIDRFVADKLATLQVSSSPAGFVNVMETYAGLKRHLEQNCGWNDEAWERFRAQNRNRICCNQALPTHCVCIVRTSCPTHGLQCHGSHD